MGAVAVLALGLATAPRSAPFLALLTPMALALDVLPLLVPALVILCLSALAEILLGLPVPLWIYVPVAIVLARANWPSEDWRERPMRLAPTVGVCVLIVVLYLVPWTPRKSFLRALDSVRPGMTLATARSQMTGYAEGTDPKRWGDAVEGSPADGVIVFRNPNEPWFKEDAASVYHTNGRVTSVIFNPD